MQKMFVIHYYINKQILDSYLHTKSEKIQYTPSVSTIKHSGPTYSTQNVRQMSDKNLRVNTL